MLQVDIVVPVVSELFLSEDNTYSGKRNSDNCENCSPNKLYNFYILDRLLNSYLNKNCKSAQVRPILVPGSKLLRRNFITPLLRYPYHWRQMPDFIQMLKATKCVKIKEKLMV